MSIKHILVPLTGDDEASHVPLFALRLAQRLKAHVTATVTIDEPQIYTDPTGIGMAPAYYDEVQKVLDQAYMQRENRARRAYDDAVTVAQVPLADKPTYNGPSTDWINGSRAEGTSVRALGRLTDLVVVCQPGQDSSLAEREALEEAIFVARRPVLVLPREAGEIGNHAAIAWNGSLEASNAIERGLDLLEPGSKITVIQVGEVPADGAPAEALVDYLGWHGFKAELRKISDEPRDPAQLILEAVRDAGAQLLVMGAYGHSRLRELILGGVTEHVLKNADMPVLMVH